jgi:hypothetical protein
MRGYRLSITPLPETMGCRGMQLDLVKISSVVYFVAVHSAKICSYPQPMEKATSARVGTHFDLDEQAGCCESAEL